MAMLKVLGLGDGTVSSAPGATDSSTTAPTAATGFDFNALPGDLITGAKMWLTPSEAITVIKDTATGGTHPSWGVVAGVALPVILVLTMVAGKHRRW